jgi:tRNA pseudouridine55 synthase
VALLGAEYDTMDRTGQVTETVDVSEVTPEALAAALPQFRGSILQKPPAFSAIKKGGKRLYELARQGETVEVEARPVQVDRLELVAEDEDGRPLEWPHFGLEIECGGGTYVRSLISDLARAAGSRAHMTALRRTKQGPFLLKHCLEKDLWRSDPEAICAHLVQRSGGDGQG